MIFPSNFWHSAKSVLLERFNLLWLFLSAALLTLSLPPFEFSFLAWFALVPLIVLLDGRDTTAGFWLGFYWGVLLWLFTAYWSIIYHFLALPGMVLIMAFYSAFLGLIYCYFQKNLPTLWPRIIIFPVLWVCVEHFRSIGIYAFPWNVVGYSQYRNLPLIQLASVGGVWLISYLIVLFNAALALLHLKKYQGNARYFPGFLLLLIAGIYLWGGRQIPAVVPHDGLRISLVQANFPNDFKYHPENIDVLIEKTRELKPQKPALIVWTETAILNYITLDPEARNKLFELSKEMNAHLVISAPNIEVDENDKQLYFNSVFLITPTEDISGVYSKIHLVPFGEFLPFARRFEWIEKLEEMVQSGGFTEGTEYKVFMFENERFGPLVCFEGVFDSLVRRFVLEGAQFMVNVTNDGWSYNKGSHYQHLAFAPFRAIENRIYFVRAGNTGVSAFIDPYGRIYAETSTFTPALLTERIGPAGEKTFYTRYGNIFVYLLWLILGGIITAALIKHRAIATSQL